MTTEPRTNPILRDRLLAAAATVTGLTAIACAVVGVMMLLGDWT